MHPISRPVRFLAIDEGRQELSLVDTAQAQPRWVMSLRDHPLARSLQRIAPDRALVGFDGGFFELEISTGTVLTTVRRWKDVTSVWRQGDVTLVTGLALEGAAGVVVLAVDGHGAVQALTRRDGDYVRLMQPAGADRYLLCTNDHILETGTDLVERRRFAAEGFLHAWRAERLDDGTTLVSAGYGAFMARFDATGALVQTFGRKEGLPAEVEPFFYATFRRRADGTLLVVNWQGHGPDNGTKGRQLLEFAADGTFLGSWSSPGHISSLQGLLLLDDVA